MLSLLALCLSAAPVSVHTDLPPELTIALRSAIERQTGGKPEITQHRADEEHPHGAEHAWSVRRATRAGALLIVQFDAGAERIDAQLIDRTGRPIRTFSIDVAAGRSQTLMSIDALDRAVFPKLESPLAVMLRLDEREVPRAAKLENAEDVAPGSFQLTVEVDRGLAGR